MLAAYRFRGSCLAQTEKTLGIRPMLQARNIVHRTPYLGELSSCLSLAFAASLVPAEGSKREGADSEEQKSTASQAKHQWALQDSNLGPIGYEPTALTAELRAPTGQLP